MYKKNCPILTSFHTTYIPAASTLMMKIYSGNLLVDAGITATGGYIILLSTELAPTVYCPSIVAVIP